MCVFSSWVDADISSSNRFAGISYDEYYFVFAPLPYAPPGGGNPLYTVLLIIVVVKPYGSSTACACN